MKQSMVTPKAPAPLGPYSQGFLVDRLLFMSGQIPTVPDSGEILSSSIQDQTRQVFRNIGAILEAANMDFSHVAKVHIFLKNLDDFVGVNEVYAQQFTPPFPARDHGRSKPAAK